MKPNEETATIMMLKNLKEIDTKKPFPKLLCNKTTHANIIDVEKKLINRKPLSDFKYLFNYDDLKIVSEDKNYNVSPCFRV